MLDNLNLWSGNSETTFIRPENPFLNSILGTNKERLEVNFTTGVVKSVHFKQELTLDRYLSALATLRLKAEIQRALHPDAHSTMRIHGWSTMLDEVIEDLEAELIKRNLIVTDIL